MKTKWTLVCLALLGLLFAVSPASAELLCVHFVNVGQGDAILLESPCGLYGLIDGGDRFRAARESLLSYLDSQCVGVLDFIVATHPHADHIGGLVSVLETRTVRRVYDSGRVHTTLLYEEFLTSIDELEVPFYTPRKGDSIEFGNLRFDVLHPTDPVMDYSLNDASIVLHLRYRDVAFLFTGDVERRGEEEILSCGFDIASHILKVAHHGSNTSTTGPFLAAVNPAIAVIQVGEGNPYGLPSQEVLDRQKAKGVEILRTDRHGHIRICTDGYDVFVDSWQDTPEADKLSTESVTCAPVIGEVRFAAIKQDFCTD